MQMGANTSRRLTATIFALLVGACAQIETPPPAPLFSHDLAVRTFERGFTTIAAKYIEPVAIGGLAEEGLRGFGAIDPNLTIARDGPAIALVGDQKEIMRWPVPQDHDPRTWADLTVKAIDAGQAASDAMRAASIEEIFEAVFDGILSRLDVYSRYAGASEAGRNRAKRRGFDGIGISFRMNKRGARIVGIMPDTPAATVGLRKNDLITYVGLTPIAGWASDAFLKRLRGPSQTSIKILVERVDFPNPLVYDLERQHIIAPTVKVHVEDDILVLEIKSFNNGTTRSARHALVAARRRFGKRLKGIVLDLRGNPGGLLKQSVSIADLFLSHGKIISTRGRHPDAAQHYAADRRELAGHVPMVVLVDGKSASASEIVAAALQDNARAIVIGTTSFGKGSVQTVIRLPNDGEMTLTWSRFITPSGKILHKHGVSPSLCTSGLTKESMTVIPVQGQQTSQCKRERRRGDFETRLAYRILRDQALYKRIFEHQIQTETGTQTESARSNP